MTSPLVLVIDDDPDLRETFRMVLEDEGICVVTTTNGAEALQWLGQCSELPCLILLDLMMPMMNGWAFRAAQMLDARIANICTAVISANVHSRLAPIEADHFLPKPVSLDKLIQLVETCCAPKA